jgi:hypothetical protein
MEPHEVIVLPESGVIDNEEARAQLQAAKSLTVGLDLCDLQRLGHAEHSRCCRVVFMVDDTSNGRRSSYSVVCSHAKTSVELCQARKDTTRKELPLREDILPPVVHQRPRETECYFRSEGMYRQRKLGLVVLRVL